MKLVYILLAVGLVKSIGLYKVFRSVPPAELKRRAKHNDKRAAALYKVTAYGASWEALLWLAGTACAGVLLIWSARTNWWLAAIVTAVTAYLVAWARFTAGGWAGAIGAFSAPYYSKLLSLLEPVLGRIAALLPPGRRVHLHTGLYEKPDLLELLKGQAAQRDNRIPEEDLKIAAGALTFGYKTVGSVMTPRRSVKLVSEDEVAGPMLTDELHQTGFSRFPVVKGPVKAAEPQITGTLYLNDLIGYTGSDKVKDLAKKEVNFINEDCSLRQALKAFIKTRHHLLIVVNNFEEMAGVISLEDIFEQIIGKQIVDEFDNYENLRAVAAMDAEQAAAKAGTIQPEQAAETVVK